MRNRKRTHRVEVAMNDHEYKKFLESVERCGMTKQAYLLFLINNRIPQPRPKKNFYDMIKQLRIIGNNINQICVVAHRTGSIDEVKFKQCQDELNQKILEIRSAVLLPIKVEDGNN